MSTIEITLTKKAEPKNGKKDESATTTEVKRDELSLPQEPIDLREIKGIGSKWSKKLMDEGEKSVQDLAALKAEVLVKIGVSEKIALRWIKAVNEILAREKS